MNTLAASVPALSTHFTPCSLLPTPAFPGRVVLMVPESHLSRITISTHCGPLCTVVKQWGGNQMSFSSPVPRE